MFATYVDRTAAYSLTSLTPCSTRGAVCPPRHLGLRVIAVKIAYFPPVFESGVLFQVSERRVLFWNIALFPTSARRRPIQAFACCSPVNRRVSITPLLLLLPSFLSFPVPHTELSDVAMHHLPQQLAPSWCTKPQDTWMAGAGFDIGADSDDAGPFRWFIDERSLSAPGERCQTCLLWEICSMSWRRWPKNFDIICISGYSATSTQSTAVVLFVFCLTHLAQGQGIRSVEVISLSLHPSLVTVCTAVPRVSFPGAFFQPPVETWSGSDTTDASVAAGATSGGEGSTVDGDHRTIVPDVSVNTVSVDSMPICR